MTHRLMKRLLCLALVFACSSAYAQDTALPEVMLLIDNSASMNRTFANGPPECIDDFKTRTRVRRGVRERVIELDGDVKYTTQGSRLHIVTRELAGYEIRPIDDDSKLACFADPTELPLDVVTNSYAGLADLHPYFAEEVSARVNPDDPTKGEYIRYLLGQCIPNNPNADPQSCTPYTLVESDTPPSRFDRDGILHRFATRIKFGMMTLDDDPNVEREWPNALGGSKSFGNEHANGGVNAGALVTTAILARKLASQNPGQQAPASPNLGAQPPGTNQPGQLIPGNMGMLINKNEKPFRIVRETENDLSRHTDFVADQLRGLSAIGFSPLTALMHDLEFYYLLQDPRVGPADIGNRFGVIADLEFVCRPHIAVLITDGGESNYYASEACLRNGNGCPAHVGFPYDRATEYVERIREKVPNFQLYVLALGIDGARRAELEGLVNQPEHLINVNSADDLRRELTKIFRFSDNNRRSRVRPLVVSPVPADEANPSVSQLRIVGYSKPVGSDRYGRIEMTAFGCGREADELGGRLQEIERENQNYAEKLVLQLFRNAFAQLPEAEGNVLTIGQGTTLFSSGGEFRGVAALDRAQFGEMTDVPPVGGDKKDPIKGIWEAISGFIGESGRPAADGSCDPFCGPSLDYVRQLGAIEDGDLIAISAPQIGLDSDSYRRFANENRNRPTLVATGAGDGQIHFFRAYDGREVFTFTPHRAWSSMRYAVGNPGTGSLKADGPLIAQHMLMCRSLGDGTDECPADTESAVFRTIVAGGIGRGGDNIFAVDITDATRMISRETQASPVRADVIKAWNVVSTRIGVNP